MFKFETLNELSLRVTSLDGQGAVFTKAGAWIEGYNGQYKFEKVLLGPQGNPMQALMGQIGRRLTGENLPLMKVQLAPNAVGIFANEMQHVTVINLEPGQTLCVESENILAFNDLSKYSVKILGQGVISQKGLFTSTLTGMQQGAQVAILTDGNPIVLNSNNGGCGCDPDAHVAHIGQDPGFKLNLSWKNLIGQASGESYQFEWKNPGTTVIIQPNERKSGLDVSVDGRRTGSQPVMQNNQTIGQAASGVGDTMSSIGGMLGGLFGR